ncbi:PucR family transcriptional regulator [Kribbella sp. NBC_00709]|uniref:PucR family transcriptional regulator n=1 Tax=Kribbella sp. NBC_00709 TaxID=2975972 RepID=UPI002E2DF31E|nr:PucR family transcriptional regulator [Kribbella sp. NBC_00709]
MVTVAEIVDLPGLRLSAVHLPAPDRSVRWVAASELPDPAPFLEGSELLLTTGLDTKAWRSQWDGYVARLADVPVAAIGIGTGLTHRTPPRGLVAGCERHGVNLIEVPHETAFVAVSRLTAELLEESEAKATRAAFDLQRRLTAAATRPDPTVSVVDTLARLMSGAACIMSADGELLVGPFGPERDALPRDQIVVEIARIRRQGLLAAASVAGIAVHPLGLTGRPSSYLAVLGSPTAGSRGAITTAVSLLGLIAEQERSRTESRRLIHDKAVRLLIDGDPTTAQLILEVQPAGFGLPSTVRILRATGADEQLDDARSQLDVLRVVAGGDGELCAAAPADRAERLAEQLAGSGLLVGVGQATALAEARASHHTAGLALAHATESTPVVPWERIRGEGPVTLIAPDTAAAFATSLLGALDPVQLATLRSFLRHHGAVLKVAEDLGIHRNTARNRLAAIETELGGSLDDPQLRVNAWIALQALLAH